MTERYFESEAGQAKINELIGGYDLASTSAALRKIIFDKDQREALFRKFLQYDTDVRYDWFNQYYSLEMQRVSKKKTSSFYTPPEVGQLVAQLSRPDSDTAMTKHNALATNYDVCAGTGQLTIQAWQADRIQHSPFAYKPSMYFYLAEELGSPSYAIPFLLFNFMIRGMDGVVIEGDSLSRKAEQVYFIQQPEDNHLGFSHLNVMPRSKDIMQTFDVRSWKGDAI